MRKTVATVHGIYRIQYETAGGTTTWLVVLAGRELFITTAENGYDECIGFIAERGMK